MRCAMVLKIEALKAKTQVFFKLGAKQNKPMSGIWSDIKNRFRSAPAFQVKLTFILIKCMLSKRMGSKRQSRFVKMYNLRSVLLALWYSQSHERNFKKRSFLEAFPKRRTKNILLRKKHNFCMVPYAKK